MLSLWFHVIGICRLSFSFFSKSSWLRFGNLKSRFSIFSNNLGLNICDNILLNFVSFSLLQNLCGLCFRSKLSQMFLIFCFNNSTALIFHSLNLLSLLFSFLDNFCLIQLDLFNIKIMLKLENNLHIISLKLQEMLVLSIVDNEHLVFLPFDLLLKINIIVCGFHQANSQVSRNDHIHDVHLLNNYSIDLKFSHEIFFKVVS